LSIPSSLLFVDNLTLIDRDNPVASTKKACQPFPANLIGAFLSLPELFVETNNILRHFVSYLCRMQLGILPITLHRLLIFHLLNTAAMVLRSPNKK